jgi:hypothetical protein
MISVLWQDLLVWGVIGLAGVYALGIASVYWWQGRARLPQAWERSARDWEQDRHGSAHDGSLRGLRWLPTEPREDH